jgi:hypothetical protein
MAAMNGSDDDEPDAFGEWLATYPKARGDLDDSDWAEHDLEAAFEAGEQAGWERATEYYRTGGSFK